MLLSVHDVQFTAHFHHQREGAISVTSCRLHAGKCESRDAVGVCTLDSAEAPYGLARHDAQHRRIHPDDPARRARRTSFCYDTGRRVALGRASVKLFPKSDNVAVNAANRHIRRAILAAYTRRPRPVSIPKAAR